MHDAALEPLSPELVLVLSPDAAAVARTALPDRFGQWPRPVASESSRRESAARRLAGLLALYAAAAALTVTPFVLVATWVHGVDRTPPAHASRR